MATLIYAARYKCDICGTEANTPAARSLGQPVPSPEGWQSLGSGWQAPGGTFVRDICPACLLLPFGIAIGKVIDNGNRG